MSKPNKAKRERYRKAHPEAGKRIAAMKGLKGIKSKFSK